MAPADVDGADVDGADVDGAPEDDGVDGAEVSVPEVAALLVADSGEVEDDSDAAVDPLSGGALGVLVGATAGTNSVADGGTV